NLCLFRLAENPDAESSWLALLPWATGVKWVGLGIAGAIGGFLLSRNSGKLAPIIITLCSLGGIAALLMLAWPARIGPHLSLAFAAVWVVFLLFGARESWRQTNPARS
ncbi:MAG TPA: hypothetical protein VET48_13255, partial [Steroidobacteraceae bacterium]|nr:hypothetical protein [Steroidobacteraceae bacterium]